MHAGKQGSSRPNAEGPGEKAEGWQAQQGGDVPDCAVAGVDVHAQVLAGMQVDAQVTLYVPRQRRQHRLLQRYQNLIIVLLQMQTSSTKRRWIVLRSAQRVQRSNQLGSTQV